MRLIDADVLFKDIVNRCGCVPYVEGRSRDSIYLNDIINEQPTAYDVNKVVEQFEKRIDNFKRLDSDAIEVDVAIKEIQMDIEIVKSGIRS